MKRQACPISDRDSDACLAADLQRHCRDSSQRVDTDGIPPNDRVKPTLGLAAFVDNI